MSAPSRTNPRAPADDRCTFSHALSGSLATWSETSTFAVSAPGPHATGSARPSAASIVSLPITTKNPRDQALTMFSTVQGAALLSSAFRDPEILASQVHRLERWIDSLA